MIYVNPEASIGDVFDLLIDRLDDARELSSSNEEIDGCLAFRPQELADIVELVERIQHHVAYELERLESDRDAAEEAREVTTLR
jgi:hypothetical protein